MDYVSKMHKNIYSHHFAYTFPEFIRPLKEFMNPTFGNSTLREYVRVLGRLWRRGKVLKGINYFSFTIALLRGTVYGGWGLCCGVEDPKISCPHLEPIIRNNLSLPCQLYTPGKGCWSPSC